MRTKQMARVAVLVAALLGLSTSARAVDVPIRYTVDANALRAAVAGTALTFELHTTPACSSAILSQVVNVEDVVLIEAVKTFKVAGGRRTAQVARLNHVLTAAPSAATSFSK
jgi:hypothetical protein